MPKTARIGDRTFGTCCHPSHKGCISVGGSITSSASKTFCEGKLVARVGDEVTSDCGHKGTIITGSAKYFTEGRLTAALGDQYTGVYKGNIVTSSQRQIAP